MSLIKIETTSAKELEAKANRINRAIVAGIVKGLRTESDALHTHIVRTHLTGAGEDPDENRRKQKLRRRTGEFVKKTKVLRVKRLGGGRYEAGVGFEAPYAPVHVGEKGKVTTIRPKNKKWLVIPLPAALTKAGVLKKKPSDYDDLFFLWADKNKAPVLARKVGKRGRIQPLFVLAKMVKIRTRIHPKEILRSRRQVIAAGIKRAIMDSVASKVNF